MARRYGRNQRRKHREALANAERLLEHTVNSSSAWRRSAEGFREQLQDLQIKVRKWDDEIRRMLGEFSAFRFETPTKEVQRQQDFVMHMLPLPPASSRWESAFRPLDSACIAVQTLAAVQLSLSMSTNDFDFSRLIRVKVRDSSRQTAWHYHMTLGNLEFAFGPREVEWLAQEIAVRWGQEHAKTKVV